jgi:hypothetical protein
MGSFLFYPRCVFTRCFRNQKIVEWKRLIGAGPIQNQLYHLYVSKVSDTNSRQFTSEMRRTDVGAVMSIFVAIHRV